jgi:hypothetical protein
MYKQLLVPVDGSEPSIMVQRPSINCYRRRGAAPCRARDELLGVARLALGGS